MVNNIINTNTPDTSLFCEETNNLPYEEIRESIKTHIDKQNNSLQKLFNKFTEEEIQAGIYGKSESVRYNTEQVLLIRKSLDGTIQVLTGEEKWCGNEKCAWKVQNIFDKRVYAWVTNIFPDKLAMAKIRKEAKICMKIRKKLGESIGKSQAKSIVKIHSITKKSETISLLMEYCGGGTFSQFKKEKLQNGSFNEYLTTILKVGNVLGDLHKIGFTHNDFHDDNVMLTDTGKVRLIDFGNARKIDQKADIKTETWLDLRYYSNWFLDPCFDFINIAKKNLGSQDDLKRQALNQVKDLIDEALNGLMKVDIEERLTMNQATVLIEKALIAVTA